MTKVNQQNGVDHIGEYYRLGYLEFRPNARFYSRVWSKTFGLRGTNCEVGLAKPT